MLLIHCLFILLTFLLFPVFLLIVSTIFHCFIFFPINLFHWPWILSLTMHSFQFIIFLNFLLILIFNFNLTLNLQFLLIFLIKFHYLFDFVKFFLIILNSATFIHSFNFPFFEFNLINLSHYHYLTIINSTDFVKFIVVVFLDLLLLIFRTVIILMFLHFSFFFF